jgi:hypothetical protein
MFERSSHYFLTNTSFVCTFSKELYQSFEEVKGEFQFATAKNTRELDEMQEFLDEAVNAGLRLPGQFSCALRFVTIMDLEQMGIMLC